MPNYMDIRTRSGTLRGIDDGRVVTLLGVPYGEDTSGTNRFAPPVPTRPWQGIREALAYGPPAPQIDTRLTSSGAMPQLLRLLYPRDGSPLEGMAVSEDCLRANIWAPSPSRAGPHPVLVWLHGGAYTHGSGNEMVFNGDIMAAREDIVVVTVSHRIGLAGFLDLRGAEWGLAGSANAGMLDVVEALRWVRDNIHLVGGDPDRVTIAGQSGGGGKVTSLLAMPRARDLFARAILQSGAVRRVNQPETSATIREAALSHMGTRDLDQLRTLPLERLLAAQREVMAHAADLLGNLDQYSLAMAIGPVLDDADLPRHPFDPEAPEDLDRKQMIVGWTTHEAGFMLAELPEYGPRLTREDVVRFLERDQPGAGTRLYDDFANSYPDEAPHLRLARILSVGSKTGALEIAELANRRAGRVWAYEFAQRTDALGGLTGPCHSLDLAYPFGTVERVPLTGSDPARLATSAEMMHAWVSFAATGQPEVPGGWPRWEHAQSPIHAFGH
ncbi:MAG: carboxylesterase family protein [Bifidobacteriaceae bacterium]|jgi:para-nitrobenzyl esterase|nr:carboxylesterase family protein [Bifidobacteriaceae bacterium]